MDAYAIARTWAAVNDPDLEVYDTGWAGQGVWIFEAENTALSDLGLAGLAGFVRVDADGTAEAVPYVAVRKEIDTMQRLESPRRERAPRRRPRLTPDEFRRAFEEGKAAARGPDQNPYVGQGVLAIAWQDGRTKALRAAVEALREARARRSERPN